MPLHSFGMKHDPRRIRYLQDVAETKAAILRAAAERARGDAATVYVARRRVADLEQAQAEALRPDDKEQIGVALAEARTKLDEAIEALDASRDVELRARDEWNASARLFDRVSAFCRTGGIPMPQPAPILGPDLSPIPHGTIR